MRAPPRRRLPLFPLPVVLFPTATMPLHIFEPRYRRMVTRCLESDRRFGLVFHDADARGPFLCEEGQVGCVAEIQDFQPLPDGRSLIVTKGVDRFRIVDGIESVEPYYEALVEPYADLVGDPVRLDAQRRRTLALFSSVIRSVRDDRVVPDLDPTAEASFPLIGTIDVAPEWLQTFLELRSEQHRLERLDAIFQAAIGRGGQGP